MNEKRHLKSVAPNVDFLFMIIAPKKKSEREREREREGEGEKIERKTNTRRKFFQRKCENDSFSYSATRSIDRKVLFVCFLAICWPSMGVRGFMNAFAKLLFAKGLM
jgi:hypothetical protein